MQTQRSRWGGPELYPNDTQSSTEGGDNTAKDGAAGQQFKSYSEWLRALIKINVEKAAQVYDCTLVHYKLEVKKFSAA